MIFGNESPMESCKFATITAIKKCTYCSRLFTIWTDNQVNFRRIIRIVIQNVCQAILAKDV